MSGNASRYSAAIMAHPRRAEPARRLADELAGQSCEAEIIFDPDPDGPPTALRTAARAWQHCPPGVSHHLVLQDDVTIAPGLAGAVATAITQHPQAALALFANSTSWNGAASRVALLAGYGWVPSVPDEWFPTMAAVMPCAMAHEFAALTERNVQVKDLGDDLLLARFLADRGYCGLVRTANLVEHCELTSIVGNDDQGIRRSVCFWPGAGEAAGSAVGEVPAWPNFAYRRSLLRMPSGHGRQRWQTRTRSEQLAITGISWPEVGVLSRQVYADLTRLPERRARCHRFLRELCLACITLGWAVAATRGPDSASSLPRSPRADAALRAYVEAGLSHQPAIDQWAGELGLLTEFAARIVELGRRLPAATGSQEDQRIESGVGKLCDSHAGGI
jgi:hypothetical protein